MKFPSKYFRNYSISSCILPAKKIRERFLDYFVTENDHTFIRSSPVLPQFDSSIPFVNAGMCQFKSIFTGIEASDCQKAANSQKCIRIGGKHNDLSVVGKDSFHHTFFEMLGNWSFGVYGKKEACSYAWHLLTSAPFSISPKKLFVTYFGGDETLNLPADHEIREIWLELGVQPDRILAFGMKENFWEMGLSGPCGTCSEIHVALTDDYASRADLVNCDNPSLFELWNIVSIKYNKTEEGISTLQQEFIDTGMGFERLVTLLQKKTSNYDTDLFQPSISTIKNICQCPSYTNTFVGENIDTAYRRLADFSRMISVAVADNVFPYMDAKLRRVLRKALHIARNDFKQESPDVLLIELAKVTSNSLCEIFPEVGERLNQIEMIIKDEEFLLKDLFMKNKSHWNSIYAKYPVLKSYSFVEYPGLPKGYEYLVKSIKVRSKRKELSPKIVNYLYNTYGLDKPVIEEITSALDIFIDWNGVKLLEEEVKIHSKISLKSEYKFEQILNLMNIKTDNSFRYNFSRADFSYHFPAVNATLLVILMDGEIVSVYGSHRVPEQLKNSVGAEIEVNHHKIGLIFDRTNFSSETSNRRFDRGIITINGEQFVVEKVDRFQNFTVHYVKVNSKKSVKLKTGSQVTLHIDPILRLQHMRNNLLGVLILAEFKKHFPLLYIQYDNTRESFMNFRFCFHGCEPDLEKIRNSVHQQIGKYVEDEISIEILILKSKKEVLNLPGISLRPGYIYPPNNIRVISIVDKVGKIIAREPDDDVVCENMKDLKPFTIVHTEILSKNILSVTCVTDDMVDKIYKYNEYINFLLDKIDINGFINSGKLPSNIKLLDIKEELEEILPKIIDEYSSKELWFNDMSLKKYENLENFKKKVDEQVTLLPEETVIKYIKDKIEEQANQGFAVLFTYLTSETLKQNDCIAEIIDSRTLPTLFFTFHNNKLKGVCCVPESKVTDSFDAESWLRLSLPEEYFDYKVTENHDFPYHRYLSKLKIKTTLPHNIKEILVNEAKNVAVTPLNSN